MIFQLSFGPLPELPAAPLETPWDSWCTAPWAPGPPAPRPSVGAPPRSVPGGAFSNHFGICVILVYIYIVYIQAYSSNILRNSLLFYSIRYVWYLSKFIAHYWQWMLFLKLWNHQEKENTFGEPHICRYLDGMRRMRCQHITMEEFHGIPRSNQRTPVTSSNPRPHERPVGREPPSQRLVGFVGAPVYQCTAPRELAPAEPSPDECRRMSQDMNGALGSF